MSPELIIETICPDLFQSPSFSVYLAMAKELTSSAFFGNVYNHAVAYRAAHLFAMTGSSDDSTSNIKKLGGGAANASMSEGGLSVSFAQPGASGDDLLGSTEYGRMLQALIKSRPKMGVNQLGSSVR